jgi:hypothetical protein
MEKVAFFAICLLIVIWYTGENISAFHIFGVYLGMWINLIVKSAVERFWTGFKRGWNRRVSEGNSECLK